MGLLRTFRGGRCIQAGWTPLLLVLLGAGCHFGKPDVGPAPDHPKFDPDVKQVLEDHCLLCHGSPADRGAPSRFRLDVYDDVGNVRGAHSEAGAIVNSAVNRGNMPPAAAWGDGVGPNGKLVLQRWLADGAPP